ncbi:M14 family metallopeptidase [Thalassomonas sp. RHCl1]|uniref:M14 family metallopeptidase n=1 Tax=Thalassomonas sp. RHCl1 TaxID=2995320 RepID=UPI00248BC273|nr:M14 family metallopeptidase [Thalassomonas sp. RHCl1]
MFFQRLFSRSLLAGFFFSLVLKGAYAAPLSEYLSKENNYMPGVPEPAAVLGFDVGDRQIRHDQLLNYFQTLGQASPRVKLTPIGQTSQYRQQLLVTISSEENLANLDSLLEKRSVSTLMKSGKKDSGSDGPLVVWLGYSVHGDEISGANASMLAAYHYAASQDKEVTEMLAQTIIVMEPSINPDGMDRFVNWVTTFRGTVANADANHIEHHQGWPSGRTNHFWFDLNRDWLLLSQKESRNRLKYFHYYQPNVLGDYHEMGANSSYFFQPGIPTRTHPLTPKENTRLTQTIAGFHARALDQEQRLYFSEENYDDFYYGKGSTYPDINGSIGILFEQASSRGMQQDTLNGLLTFDFGIKNHLLTSLSTVEGAWKNKDKLTAYRKKFYQQGLKLAGKEKFSGYLLHEGKDSHRLFAFLDKLKQHQIQVYPLTEDYSHNGKQYRKENSYFVPLEQPQYRVIQALFNQETNFRDNTFYDVSGWTMALAMNIEFQKVERTWGLELAKNTWQRSESQPQEIDENAYAYGFEWHHFLAPKMLNQLLAQRIKAKVATKAFTAAMAKGNRSFKPGTIVIPAGLQKQANWRELVARASQSNNIEMISFSTGFTPKGIDFGSNSLRPLSQVKTLLVGGVGVSQYEAGEIRYYLDELLNVPVSVVEQQRLAKINLSDYSHVIFVDGNYSSLPEATVTKLTAWVKQGGTLFAQKRGAKWLADKELLKADFVSNKQLDQLFDTENLIYGDKEALAGRKRIAGAIFNTRLDTSHPLAYGYDKAELPMFRNSTLIMDRPTQPFISVASYTEEPLLSGYTDRNLVNRIANNSALVAHNLGKGRIIATSDNFVFRGYWYGSAKLLANSLFFAKAFHAPVRK